MDDILKNYKPVLATDLFKNIQSPIVKIDNLLAEQNRQMNKEMQKVFESKQKEKRADEQYKQNVLEALKNIERNTANLTDIITLIRNNQDKQDELISLLTEVLSISKAESIEEADNLYRKVINKVQAFTTDVDVMQKLFGLTNTVYGVVTAGIKIIGG